MMDTENKHYFTDNRNLPSNRKEHSFYFQGNTFSFVSDTGVFSKSGVDYGTRVLLETIGSETLGNEVLDLGCGYGVIGIVVKAMHPTVQVTGIDINPRAVELTEENAKRNHVEMKTYVGDGFTDINQTFDTILTNPPIRAGKSVIYSLFRDSYVHLNEGGKLVVVIRKQQGANSAKQELETIYGNCEIRTKEKGYWILIAKK